MVKPPNYGPVFPDACRMVGGTKPVHPSTYYRGVRAGRYAAPEHPSPNISRVNLDTLAAMLLANAEREAVEREATASKQKEPPD
jgi:hypothetical protein